MKRGELVFSSSPSSAAHASDEGQTNTRGFLLILKLCLLSLFFVGRALCRESLFYCLLHAQTRRLGLPPNPRRRRIPRQR